MITGIKLVKVEARRDKEEDMTGLNVNIGLDSVALQGEEIAISFTYSAVYLDGVGEISMKGVITSKEDEKLTSEILSKWEKEKKLPDHYAEMMLNAINYACGTNGVFVARPVNLSPPIVPPKIQLSQGLKK